MIEIGKVSDLFEAVQNLPGLVASVANFFPLTDLVPEELSMQRVDVFEGRT